MCRFHAQLALIIFLVATPAFAQEQIPYLVGTWKATITEVHVKGKDFLSESGVTTFHVLEQKGRILHGTKEWSFAGNNHKGSDRFSGVIAKDNKTIYIAGHEEGVRIGHIDGQDAITIYFIIPGRSQPRAGYSELTRVK